MGGNMGAGYTDHEGYEKPALTEYGTIEEWTQGPCTDLVCVSIILP